ncbi:MAG: hypothetical protein LAT64_06295 [Phycisphaerales bacterium]|nr:hypothetical protein [Planctomycetota bacterium]MCH8508365.1 hypothetical protein [Phycisphaerales bacterium]
MWHSGILSLIALLVMFSSAAHCQSTAASRDMATPQPVTPTWLDSRNRIVQADNVDDRVVIAKEIKAACLDQDSDLSSLERYDGLHIAGHGLYQANKFDAARLAFEGIQLLGYSPETTADAGRMLAQISMWMGKHSESFDKYKETFDLAAGILDFLGEPSAPAAGLVRPMLGVGMTAGRSDEVVQLANDIIAVFAGTTKEGMVVPICLELGSEAAMKAGQEATAARMLETLLDDYPEHGMHDPLGRPSLLRANRPELEIRLALARGYSLEECHPLALEAALRVLKNDDYRGMRAWYIVASQVASCLEYYDDLEHANLLRNKLIEELDQRLTTLVPTDPIAHNYRSQQANLLMKIAESFVFDAETRELATPYLVRLRQYGDVAPSHAEWADRTILDYGLE